MTTFLFLIHTSLYSYWTHFAYFDSFTGKVKSSETQKKLKSINYEWELENYKNMNNKVLIFNFWHTNCGYCKLSFPKFKELSLKHESPDTLFIALNYPLKNDNIEKVNSFFNLENGNVNLVIPEDNQFFIDNNINTFPSFMVINKLNNIEFYGSIEMFENFLTK